MEKGVKKDTHTYTKGWLWRRDAIRLARVQKKNFLFGEKRRIERKEGRWGGRKEEGYRREGEVKGDRYKVSVAENGRGDGGKTSKRKQKACDGKERGQGHKGCN